MFGFEGDVEQDLRDITIQGITEIQQGPVQFARDELDEELEDHDQPDQPEQKIKDHGIDQDKKTSGPDINILRICFNIHFFLQIGASATAHSIYP